MPMEFKVQLDEEIVVTVNDDGTIREVWGADEDRTYDHSSFLDWATSFAEMGQEFACDELNKDQLRSILFTIAEVGYHLMDRGN